MNNFSNLKLFPLLIPEDQTLTKFSGFIQIYNKSFNFRISMKNPQKISTAKIQCNKELENLLIDSKEIISKRLKESENLNSFLLEFSQIIQQKIEPVLRNEINTSFQPKNPIYFQFLFDEINEIGWEKIQLIDENLSKIQINLKDSKNRTIPIFAQIPPEFPFAKPIIEAPFPVSFENDEEMEEENQQNTRNEKITKNQNYKGSFQKVINKITREFDKYQDLWDNLDDFDSNTCVIEPENPTLLEPSRKILFGKHCSIQIVFNIKFPRSVPSIKFFGSDPIILPLKELLKKDINKWDPKNLVRKNLEEILKIEFPKKTSSSLNDFGPECGICFGYQNDGKSPDIFCSNIQCARPFHNSCLYLYLKFQSSDEFGTIYGKCPYCSHEIQTTKPIDFQEKKQD
ncbi:ubiquitin ligase protein phf9 fanconi anemia group l protein [Anaeramoeba ignava]|uniref:Ubiquitin ligase protein phf9 fanconi anemia group l protein n=1 Tax=Anaeramoeba ignava TaxID=1746090 RepID=A0A9Q0RBA0_ANAIG|nr:ubiquitin ligase protein phf9 fanconi anemia group l protein [Anaeramoeba ignava]